MRGSRIRIPAPGTLCQAYLMAVLLAAALLTPFPYSASALLMLAGMLFGLRYRSPRLHIVLTVTILFILPLALSSLAPYVGLPLVEILATLAALPALYLLDAALRQNAPRVNPRPRGALTMTPVSTALFATAGSILAAAALTGSRVLAFSSAALVLYLLAALALTLRNVPRDPAHIPTIEKRIVALATADITLTATGRCNSRLYCYVRAAEPWVQVTPQRFMLNGKDAPLNVTITPPLSGPATGRLHLSLIDERGLLQREQTVDALALQVIPRAKYAEWLAIRYLEQAGATSTASTSTSRYARESALRRGADYHESRTYQPGDRLRDIDWKHTIKLRQLITREYADVGGQSAIIAVNLAAPDAAAADRLAFNLITTALTLAEQGIPAALAAYDTEKSIATVPLTHPAEVLKEALSLVRQIVQVAVPQYSLQPPDMKRLRRNMAQLEKAESHPAKRLLGILDLELQAVEYAARRTPETQALVRIAGQVPPPAVVILVSSHSAPQAPSILEKLEARGFSTLVIGG